MMMNMENALQTPLSCRRVVVYKYNIIFLVIFIIVTFVGMKRMEDVMVCKMLFECCHSVSARAHLSVPKWVLNQLLEVFSG